MTHPGSRSDAFPLAVMVESGLALLAVVLAWLFGVTLQDQLPPWGEDLAQAIARGVVATVPMLAAFWWIVRSERPSLQRLRRQVDWLIGQMFPTAGVGQLGLIALLAGVGEELLFRGVLQRLLIDWTNPAAGLVIASLVFGAAHALSKLYFLFATLIGFLFGWMAWYYDDLVGPIVAHSLYDFVALVYLVRIRRGAHRPADDGE